MAPSDQVTSRRRWLAVWPSTVAFGAAYYAYAWLFADLYTRPGGGEAFPIFSTRPSALHGALARPGGLCEYLSGLLAQSLYSGWLGPLVLAALASSVVAGTGLLIRRMGAPDLVGLAVAPGALLLTALNRGYCSPTAVVGLALAVWSGALYAGLGVRSETARAGVLLALGCAVYYVAGGPLLLFAIVCAVHEFLVKRATLTGLVAALTMGGVPYVTFTWLLPITRQDAFLRGLPLAAPIFGEGGILLPAAYASVIALALVCGVLSALQQRRLERSAKHVPQDAPIRPAWVRHRIWVYAVLAVAWVGVTAGTYNASAGCLRRLHYCGRQRLWEGVLSEADRLPLARRGPAESQQINRALFELGRMSEAMFSLDQGPRTLAFDIVDRMPIEEATALLQARDEAWFKIGDLNLALGDVNESQHQASEALASMGPHPQILLHLARCHLVKRQAEAARLYLRALGHDLRFCSEARRLLDAMQDDPLLDTDPDIRHLRSVALIEDRPLIVSQLQVRCRTLLDRNPTNRMAFEYLMAALLLLRDLDGFATEVGRLPEVGYDHIPRHYEEALLILEKEAHRDIAIGDLQVSSETRADFAEFCAALEAIGTRDKMTGAQLEELAERHGRTYWFYYVLGSPGALAR